MYRILVVDDEERIRQIIRKYAEFEGYQVEEGIQWDAGGTDFCRHGNFGRLFVDIMMPELDGFFRLQRSGKPHPPR